jgi:hypothetical protein
MKPKRLQPAVFGGLLIGVLSALPIVSVGNCCCLWIVGGGLLAAYLMQANHPEPIDLGDGAVAGLLAGIIGAFVWALVSLPMNLVLGPFQARMLERIMDASRDVPDGVRTWIRTFRYEGFGLVRVLVGFTFMLIAGMVCSTVGGLVGAALFQRKSTGSPGVQDQAATPQQDV